MPPVPGPVFSKAFNALIVMMIIGCGLLCLNLRDTLQRMKESEIGEDNEVLTRGNAGNAKWLESIQKTKGRAKGLAPVPLPDPVVKKGKKDKKSSKRRAAVEDEDSDEQEMAPLSSRPGGGIPRPKPKPKASPRS